MGTYRGGSIHSVEDMLPMIHLPSNDYEVISNVEGGDG